ncbi:hypothetical protein [Alteromonas sp. BMJM2]|uniref:hypothetical protein n=1 Tax=Alteromonas sp. BMJM2 TaxID=2954241 RepID=UPI0022B417DA|nr:hypothetical protein [Alteromonas sp. BMJM2]
MSYVYLVLNWLFGVIFFLLGIVTVFSAPVSGLALLLMSTLLIPPVRDFAFSKTHISIPVKIRAISLIALFFITGYFSTEMLRESSRERQAERELAQSIAEAKAKQDTIDYFEKHRNSIMNEANTAFDNGEYSAVSNMLFQYVLTGDTEVQELHRMVNVALEKKRIETATESILSKLKKLPATRLEENRDLYEQLVKMHPENTLYSSKFEQYDKRFGEAERLRKANQKRADRIQAQFNAWDGSHRALEYVIKKSMHNPDSYEHVETTFSDKGDHLIVQTVYRGTNGFGAIVKNFIRVKVTLDGQLLEVIDKT